MPSSKKPIPDTYVDAIKNLYQLQDLFDIAYTEKLSQWVDLRSIIVHKHLDLIWKKLLKFLNEVKPQLETFLIKQKRY